MQDPSIVDSLLPVLQTDLKAVELLKKRHIKPLLYVAYRVDRERRKQLWVGRLLTMVLTILLFGLGYLGARESSEGSVKIMLIFGFLFGLLGLGLGLGAIKMLEGKRISKYIENPDSQVGSFTLLGILNTFKSSYIKKISDAEWHAIESFVYHPSDPQYRLQTGIMSENEKSELMQLTPSKKALVKKLEGMQRLSAWLILVGMLAFFTKGLFFMFLAFGFGSLWFFLEGLIGVIVRKSEAFSEGQDINIYGRPAQIIGVIVMITGGLFLLGSILGAADALGYDLIELLF